MQKRYALEEECAKVNVQNIKSLIGWMSRRFEDIIKAKRKHTKCDWHYCIVLNLLSLLYADILGVWKCNLLLLFILSYLMLFHSKCMSFV